ncbi:MAG: tetratricopeptide repeat protein [Bacteroidota bacterium]|nr:tetratricopeptide repeat protein [Bacteroidota bacterium]
MKYPLRIAFLLLCFFVAESMQAKKTKEQLWKELKETPLDSIKVDRYISLSNLYEKDNIDSALWTAREALKLSLKINYTEGLCASNQKIGIVYQNSGKYKEANGYFFTALKYAEQLNSNGYKLQIFNSIANACAYQKMYSQALIYYEKALQSAEESGLKNRTGTILMNMGNIAYSKGYYKKEFKEAIAYFDKALKIGEETLDSNLLSSVYGNYALVYTDAEQFDDALKMVEKGMALAKARGVKEDYVFLYYYAGRAYAHSKQYEKAEYNFKESIKYCLEMEDRDYLSENYLSLAEMYDDIKNYKEAYNFMYKHKVLEDSLLNEETTNQLNELKTVYETEKKEKEIELSHQKLQTQDAKLNTIIFSAIGGALSLLILVFFIYTRYQIKQKANKKLETAYSIIEEKQKDITDSINYAQKIQYAILPSDDDIKNAFTDSFVFFQPRDIVSGDFYWFHSIAGNTQNTLGLEGIHTLIAAADCTGHGVPGALMSMIGSSLLNQIVLEGKVKNTGEILDLLRTGIKAAFKQKQGEDKRRDGMDIGLLAFSNNGTKVFFSGANNGVYHVRNLPSGQTGAELKDIKPDKQPVGQHVGEEKPFTCQEIEVQKGDCLYLYTDGFADQFGGETIPGKQSGGKKFKYAKLKELLAQISTKNMQEQKSILENTFNQWKGKYEQVDDVLIIGVRV